MLTAAAANCARCDDVRMSAGHIASNFFVLEKKNRQPDIAISTGKREAFIRQCRSFCSDLIRINFGIYGLLLLSVILSVSNSVSAHILCCVYGARNRINRIADAAFAFAIAFHIYLQWVGSFGTEIQTH